MTKDGDAPSSEHTAAGELLLRTFGPVADALALELAKLPPAAAANLGRLVERVRQRRRSDPEEVSSRLLHRVLDEAAWAEHEIVTEYLSGVLASSGSGVSNDRGLGAVAQIQRLSAIQLRAHYIIYRELVSLADPVLPPLDVDLRWSANRMKYHLEFPLTEFVQILGVADLSPRGRRDVMNHVVLGLAKEELVDHDAWALVTDLWKHSTETGERVSFHPTPLGAELFLWGCASPVTDQAQLFDPGLELRFDLELARPRGAKIDSDFEGEPMDVEDAEGRLSNEDVPGLLEVASRMLARSKTDADGLTYRGLAHAMEGSWEAAERDLAGVASRGNLHQFSKIMLNLDYLEVRRPSNSSRIRGCAAAVEHAYRGGGD